MIWFIWLSDVKLVILIFSLYNSLIKFCKYFSYHFFVYNHYIISHFNGWFPVISFCYNYIEVCIFTTIVAFSYFNVLKYHLWLIMCNTYFMLSFCCHQINVCHLNLLSIVFMTWKLFNCFREPYSIHMFSKKILLISGFLLLGYIIHVNSCNQKDFLCVCQMD